MKLLSAFIAVLSVGLAVSGCGGNGPGTNLTLQRSYSGTWTSTSMGDNGTMSLAISSNGATTGTFADLTSGKTGGAVDATLTGDGTFTGNVSYQLGAPMIVTGTLTVSGNGHLTGTIFQYTNGGTYATAVDLTPV